VMSDKPNDQHAWERKSDHWFCATCEMRAFMSDEEFPTQDGCYVLGSVYRAERKMAEKAEADLAAERAENKTLWRCFAGRDDMVCEMIEAARAPSSFRAKEIILRVHEVRDAVRTRNAAALAAALGVGEE
jgi:hypothetical protein